MAIDAEFSQSEIEAIVVLRLALQAKAETARTVARADYKAALADFWAAEDKHNATRAALDFARAAYATKRNSHELATAATLEAEEALKGDDNDK